MITLQLADKSIKYPHGVVEDVLAKVGKFIFPEDFVLMDVEEDEDVSLFLGKPFMNTAKVTIDVDDINMRIRTQEDEATFDIFEGSQPSTLGKDCLKMDIKKEASLVVKKKANTSTKLKKTLRCFIPQACKEKKKVITIGVWGTCWLQIWLRYLELRKSRSTLIQNWRKMT